MLPLRFWSCVLSTIILVCCFGINDAVPFGAHPGGEVRSTAPRQTKTRSVTKKIVPDLPESLAKGSQLTTGSSVQFSDIRRSNTNFNSNVNVNTVHLGTFRPRRKHPKKDHKKSIKYEIDDNSVESYDSDLEPEIERILSNANEKATEESSEKCSTEPHGANRPFNQNIPMNASPIDIAGAFKVAGEPEAKKTSSVHVDEEITLCWIETTRIKEDPAFDPPKRLVVREFAISFENSATIPDDYLECAKLDGEISTGDVETVCKTSLHEVIYENTRRSVVANFTTVSHIGTIVVREQKKVRCATGGIVSKDVYEWPNESDNPKKRVEIKVGPSIRGVDVGSGEEFLQCGTEDVTRGPEKDRGPSSMPNCTSKESCATSIGSSCGDGDCTTKNPLIERNVTTDYSDIDKLVSTITTIIGKATTEESGGMELVEQFSEKPVRSSEDSCPENDPNCELGKATTNVMANDIASSSSDESTSDVGDDESTKASSQCFGDDCTHKEESSATTSTCSGEDCSGESLEKLTKVTSDGSKDTSSPCSGEDCVKKEESSAATKPCFGEDCSGENIEESTQVTSDGSKDTSSSCSGEGCVKKEESNAATKPCLGEDCSGENIEESTAATSDGSKDTSSSCSGEDCTNKEEPDDTTELCSGEYCSDTNDEKLTKVTSNGSTDSSSPCSGEDCTSKEGSSATTKVCFGEDCSGGNPEKSTKVTNEEIKDTSSQCSGEDCTSKEGSSAIAKPCSGEDCSDENPDKSTKVISEGSKNTSIPCSGEDCASKEGSSTMAKPCSGEDCSDEKADKSTNVISEGSKDTSIQCSGEDCTSKKGSSATTEACLGEDCSDGNPEKSTKVTNDEIKGTSSQCSGEDCTSKEGSSAMAKPCSSEDCSDENPEKSTKVISEESKDISIQCSGEDCMSKEGFSATTEACLGEDCSGGNLEKSTKVTNDEIKDTSSQCSGEDCTSKEGSSAMAKSCSGEDCSDKNPDKSTKVISEESKDTSIQCSGEDCPSKEESGITQPETITVASTEPCQEGSESCACNGSLCMIQGSGESGILSIENKLTVGTAAPPVRETNETLLKDSECDGDSDGCSHLLITSSDEEEKNKKSTLASDKNDHSTDQVAMKHEEKSTPTDLNVTTITDEKKIESLDTFDSTEVSKSEDVSEGVTVKSCDASESGECTTVAPVRLTLSNDMPGKTENDTSSTEGPELSITTKNDLHISETASGGSDQSYSCKEGSGDENCQSTGPSSDSEADDIATTDFSSNAPDSNVPSLSENSEKIETPYDGDVTLMTTTSVEFEPTTIEAVTEVPELVKTVKLSDERLSSKDSRLACGGDSEDGSGDCSELDQPSSSEETSSAPLEVTGISSSTEANTEASANLAPIGRSHEESSCDDSTESCFTSSSGANSEICKDGSSSSECTKNATSSEACDLSSGSCSSETNGSTDLTDEAITTTTESTSNELEHLSTTIENVSTTAETRRSTAPTLSLMSTPTKENHKLALRIKVLLEHINENKEKQKLVQVEKHLLLNEKPEEHGNHSLVWKIRSLNNSINMETFKSIFNCTALENLTENFSQLTEFKQKSDDGIVLQKTVDNPSVEESTESQDNSEEESSEGESRRKRELFIPGGNRGDEEKNVTDRIKVKAIKESLPGVNEDLQKGLDHALHRISQELENPVTSPLTKTAESSPSKILKILADPDDRRVHSRRRRRATKVGGVVSLEELEHPVNGEGIDRWSNERFVTVADGSRVRSLLEFEILRAPDVHSRRIFS